MDRRAFLAAAISTVSIGLAGCSGVLESVTGGGTNEFGDPVEYRGIEITPMHWFTAGKVGWDTSHTVLETTAQSGATLLLFGVEVAHVGENERQFPSRASGYGHGTGDIRVMHNGEETSHPRPMTAAESLKVGGKSLTHYEKAWRQEAMSSVYSGVKISGWLVNELSANFEPVDVELVIEWGAKSSVENEDLKEHSWVLTEDTETTVEEAAGVEANSVAF
ncbi:hypothetical protein [Halovivax limisalsi]|uniref:hypothetical protein n=1 Tax=Halovivax limisalsi TaxID=1453760 RepID=UPI001FFC7594|nr:hypothetical protein [Halovivax limisalsi]